MPILERLAIKTISPAIKLGAVLLAFGIVGFVGYRVGHDEATEACQIKQLESDKQQLEEDIVYFEEWFAKQQAILKNADTELDIQLGAIRSIQRNVSNLATAYEDLAARNPLDPSCDAGPERVRRANEAIRAASGAAALRGSVQSDLQGAVRGSEGTR